MLGRSVPGGQGTLCLQRCCQALLPVLAGGWCQVRQRALIGLVLPWRRVIFAPLLFAAGRGEAGGTPGLAGWWRCQAVSL